MHLKAFGGYFNQQWIAVKDDKKPGDHWRVPIPLKLSTWSPEPPEVSTIKTEEYVIESVRTPQRSYWFLRLASLPLEAIFQEVFS